MRTSLVTPRSFLLSSLIVLMLVVIGSYRITFAQEITATVEATPPAAIVIPPSDAPVVIPGTSTTPTIIIEPSPIFNPINPIILVTGSIIILLLGFGIAVLHGKNPDTAAVEQVQALRNNQPVMDDVHAGYEASGEQVKLLVQTLETVVKAIAPLTPIKIDDELGLLLNDITDPAVRAQVAVAVKAALVTTPIPEQKPPISYRDTGPSSLPDIHSTPAG